MAEGEVELEVVISGGSLVAISGIEGSGIGEEEVGVDTLVGSLAFISCVIGYTTAEIGVPSALHLVLTDQSPLFVLGVE